MRRCAEGNDLHISVPISLLVRAALADVLLQYAVKVAATEAEGTDRCSPRMAVGREPRAFVRVHVEGRGARRDLRQRLFDLQRGRQHFVVKRHRCLDQGCGARCGLGVSNLRLHRTERTPRALRPALTVDRSEGFGLGGVSYDRTGTVGLDELHGIGRGAGTLVGPAQRLGLTRRTRRIDGVALAVARCAQTTDLGVDAVAVVDCVVQALQDEDAHSFTEDGAVAFVVEGTCIAGGAQRGRLREAHVHEDVVERVDTAGDGHVAAAVGELHGG